MAADKGEIRSIDAPGWPARPTMAQAVVCGGIAYLSGVVPSDAEGRLVGAGDPEAQARACIDALAAVLAAAGTGLDNVLRATCYATSAEAAAAYIAERARRMGQRPAATTVLVSGTLLPGAMLEVEVIARVPA